MAIETLKEEDDKLGQPIIYFRNGMKTKNLHGNFTFSSLLEKVSVKIWTTDLFVRVAELYINLMFVFHDICPYLSMLLLQTNNKAKFLARLEKGNTILTMKEKTLFTE